jgi:RNA polymerase sporulation-specific sigma factor
MPGILTAFVFMIREMIVFVSYIKNNAFPQPLSEQEEEHNLQRMTEGDLQARNTLIEHNLRLVAHIVKKFENTGEDTGDLISIGTIGLIKAIESYQTNKGTKLATYAARCIENEVLMSVMVSKCINLYAIRKHDNFLHYLTDQFFLIVKRQISFFQIIVTRLFDPFIRMRNFLLIF